MVRRGRSGCRCPWQVLGECDGRDELAGSPGRNRRAESTHRRRPGRDQTDTGGQGPAAHRGAPHDHFRSTRITGTPHSFEITGELTIKGRIHPATVHGKANNAGPLRGSATVTQSTWGIKPYTAFLGALRLADDVRVEFEMARLEPADGPGSPPRTGRT
ncbi:YceI family protein [Streptomyces cupreus]|uniref:YceI family protein n=1 Tax=Streptomyces cupreus TaxID=2759956 RepID=UPI0021B2E5ED|nr:YceI family protein [Streptomyces cupreus]